MYYKYLSEENECSDTLQAFSALLNNLLHVLRGHIRRLQSHAGLETKSGQRKGTCREREKYESLGGANFNACIIN